MVNYSTQYIKTWRGRAEGQRRRARNLQAQHDKAAETAEAEAGYYDEIADALERINALEEVMEEGSRQRPGYDWRINTD